MPIPSDLQERIKQGHEILVENLADTDDAVLEMVVDGQEPPLSVLEEDLKKAVRTGGMIPVLVGAGLNDAGVLCLLDAVIALCPSPLDHDYKDADGNLIEVKEDGPVIAQVLRTYIHPQFGKLSLARIFSGTIRSDSKLVNNSTASRAEERIGGLYHLQGKKQDPVQSAGPGMMVAIARMEHAKTGDTLASNGCKTVMNRPVPSQPLYVLSVAPKSRADEGKVLPLMAKLLEEDPTLTFEWDPEMHEHRLGGYGELLLSVSLHRLERQYHLQLTTERPKIAYKEAIQKYVEAHGKHKKQTGGHGQFGEVYIKIESLERGTGNKFSQSIVGGSIPHQYIPGVEKGVKEALQRGPLAGFPVVDVSVNLYDGAFHDVDSDEMSFRMAAIMALREGLPKASPQILEPIAAVTVTAPSANISGVLAQITARRGQILGYSAKEDYPGWDEVSAYVPQRELWDYIIDLRTLTHGLGTYTSEFSHLAPVTGSLESELKKLHTTTA
jgi:elongation factor G